MALRIAPPYAKHSDTSRAAAESVAGGTSALRAKVLAYIRAQGIMGATCDEVEAALGMRHQTASARVYELRELRLVVDGGGRRPTRSGRKATIWIAPPEQAGAGAGPAAPTPEPPVGPGGQLGMFGDLDH